MQATLDNPWPELAHLAGIAFPRWSTKRFHKCGGSHYNERIASRQFGEECVHIPHGRICAALQSLRRPWQSFPTVFLTAPWQYNVIEIAIDEYSFVRHLACVMQLRNGLRLEPAPRLEQDIMIRLKQVLALILVWGIVLVTSPANASMYLPPQDAAPAPIPASQIDSLVAPIALYPDALVAQVLAASTYPNEVVEADQWLKDHSSLQGDALAQAVNQQPWDPSVQALTQFPSVLDQMANNLSWTSSLGDAFYNQQADVMAAVQRLRAQAKAAGNLNSTSQMTVTQPNPQTIVIAPANPQVVYVPTYSPTVVYGTPYYPPGYSTGAVVATGLISFGVGFAVGAAMSGGCCGWGWNNWNSNWHGGTVVYNRNTYVSRSNVYANGNRYRNGAYTRPTPYGSNNYNRNNVNRNTNVSGNTVNVNGGNRNNVNANNGNRQNNIGNGNNNGNRQNNNAGNANNRPGQNNGQGNRQPGQNNANRPQQNNRPQNNAAKPANSAYRGYGQQSGGAAKSGAVR